MVGSVVGFVVVSGASVVVVSLSVVALAVVSVCEVEGRVVVSSSFLDLV